MSHLPNQPLEVPSREVHHAEDEGESSWESSNLSVGEAKQTALWLRTNKDEADFDKELKRKDDARAQLGGFGFRST